MSEPIFREATADDIPATVALLADDVLGAAREDVSTPPAPAYVAAFEAVRSNPHDTIIVAELDGEVAACAQLTILFGLSHQGMRRGQIESVRVASAHRGSGLGEALFRVLEARARAAGCGVLQLTSNSQRERARKFYERIGFVASHTGMKRVL